MKLFYKIAIILMLTVSTGIGLFFTIETEEDPEFGVESVKDMRLDFDCPIQFKDGRAVNLEEYCPQQGIEAAEIYNLKERYGLVFGFLELVRGERNNFLVIIDESGIVTKREIKEKPQTLSFDRETILVDSARYGFVEGRLIKLKEERKQINSAKYGISVEIPVNWEHKKEADGYKFYHPEAENYFFKVTFKGELKEKEFPEGSFYREKMQFTETAKVNTFEDLPDYRFFRSDLDDYLEINTVTGEINYHKNDQIHRFDVLASGDPAEWNGTPSGLYRILSKEGLRFSTESEVYMPFSMRIYGKYLIHGEAYFPSGAPYTSAVSGGCVRVRNEEMTNLYDLVEASTPVLSITHEKSDFEIKETNPVQKPDIEADNYLLVDLDSGKIFDGKNYDQEVTITHLTKLMTAIVTTEQMGVKTPLTARDYMLGEDDTNAKIKPGQSFRLVDLLAPLLVESSDNAARVLSHYLGRDNTFDYIQEKAKAIGMKESRFEDTVGVKESTTTPKDLYYLLYYLKNTRKPILDITKAGHVPHINYEVFKGLKNKNVFYEREDFSGGLFEVGEKGHSGAFLFEKELGGEKRDLAIIMINVPTERSLVRDIDNLKEWLEKSFN